MIYVGTTDHAEEDALEEDVASKVGYIPRWISAAKTVLRITLFLEHQVRPDR